MRKTHGTYIAMVAVFGLGLWGILHFGGTLRAAVYVAGDWQVRWNTTGASPPLPDRLTIGQSGRYLNATLRRPDSSGAVQLRGELHTSPDRAGISEIMLASSDERWQITAAFHEGDQRMSGHLKSTQTCGWEACRIAPAAAPDH